VFAVVALSLNAALLIAAAVVGGEPALLWWAAVFVLAAVGVVLLRRRYVRHLGDIAQARRRLRAELRALHAPDESGNGS
jgi:hypothetical protein